MTLQEALTILTTHQAWRLGAEIEMAEPKVITEALDVVLAYHHVGTNEMVEKNKTMTAVEWLIEKLHNKQYGIFDGIPILSTYEIYAQAKEMEKQQIIDAFEKSRQAFIFKKDMPPVYQTFEQYYNETYGSKGSDETSPQTEISDEEIEKWVASTPYYGHCTPEYKEGLEEGAKWYREQLKQNK